MVTYRTNFMYTKLQLITDYKYSTPDYLDLRSPRKHFKHFVSKSGLSPRH
jgi:hypothetical protein